MFLCFHVRNYIKTRLLVVSPFSAYFYPRSIGDAAYISLSPVPRPPLFSPSVCIHNNTREQNTPGLNFRRSSDSVYYCECKRKIKTWEAWDRGYISLVPSPPSQLPQSSKFKVSLRLSWDMQGINKHEGTQLCRVERKQ